MKPQTELDHVFEYDDHPEFRWWVITSVIGTAILAAAIVTVCAYGLCLFIDWAKANGH